MQVPLREIYRPLRNHMFAIWGFETFAGFSRMN